jgi:hypothetical protein
MGTFLQTILPPVLAFFAGYQGGLTRTGRLRNTIQTSVELLDKLPAEHPSRATLEAHIAELVDTLVRRQRRRFEPITRAGVSFGANATLAVLMVVVVCGMALQATGIWDSNSNPLTRGELWAGTGFYGALGLCFAGFGFKAWRQQQREHPKSPQPGRA